MAINHIHYSLHLIPPNHIDMGIATIIAIITIIIATGKFVNSFANIAIEEGTYFEEIANNEAIKR